MALYVNSSVPEWLSIIVHILYTVDRNLIIEPSSVHAKMARYTTQAVQSKVPECLSEHIMSLYNNSILLY